MREWYAPGSGARLEPAACHHGAMINADRGPAVPLRTDRPCWYCVHWAGPCWGDPFMADCRRGGQKACVANAATGCAHWMREIGVDDDGWSPAARDLPKTPRGKPFAMTAELYATVRTIQADVDRQAETRPC